jgi:hypothetical protein
MSSLGEVVPDELCYQFGAVHPGDHFCPATKPCPLSPYCHPIKYQHGVKTLGNVFEIYFTPMGKDIRRRKLEWVDVHVAVEDFNGNAVMELQNHRMNRPDANALSFDFTKQLPANKVVGLAASVVRPRLAYSFTYCIEMIDCDTAKYYFDL